MKLDRDIDLLLHLFCKHKMLSKIGIFSLFGSRGDSQTILSCHKMITTLVNHEAITTTDDRIFSVKPFGMDIMAKYGSWKQYESMLNMK